MHTFRCAQCGALNRVPEKRVSQKPICGQCKARLDVSGTPQEVDALELERAVAASPVPVLVDVWAPWCGPCRLAAPVVERLAKSRAGLVIVLKVNSDSHPEVSRKHRIQGIPAFIMFRRGVEAARQVGLLPEGAFARWVDGFALAA